MDNSTHRREENEQHKKMRVKKEASSRDVAKLAGVSQTTVSYVLSNRPGEKIPDETRQRVFEAARTLRYKQNRLVHGVMHGVTRMFGVVTPMLNQMFYGSLVDGIMDACIENDYQMIVTRSHRNPEVEAVQFDRLNEYRVDGVIYLAGVWEMEKLSSWFEEVQAKDIPTIIVNERSLAGIIDSVVSDDFHGSKMAVEHLIGLGHRKIVHLAGENSPGADRIAGYRSAMEKAGIGVDPTMIVGNSFYQPKARMAATELLERPSLPTAIFAANDEIAMEVMRAASDRGIRIPEDIALVGYGNVFPEPFSILTTVCQQLEHMGRIVVQRLLARLENRSLPKEEITVDTKLIVRKSCGAIS